MLKDFPSLDEARTWIFGDATKERPTVGPIVSLIERAREPVAGLSAKQISEAAAAFKRLEGRNMSLTEAVDFALRHARPESETISVSEAIENALREKGKNRRPKYIQDLGKRWRRFERWLPAHKKQAINTILPADIREFLNVCDLAPVGERNMLRNISVLFAWAKKHLKIDKNPCEGMVVEESLEKRPVRILSIPELNKMLALASSGFSVQAPDESQAKLRDQWHRQFGCYSFRVEAGELVPWIVLGCFDGFRPEETEQIDWKDIDFKRRHVDLPASKSKTRERRIVKMPDNLIEWLRPYKKASGRVVPENFRRKRWALRNLMGWDEWPEDILRHSFGSYHLAEYQDSGKTADMMGHKNPRTLFNYYREVVKEESDVKSYWNIKPKAKNS